MKWAVCNYDDIKPDKIFGPDSLLICTGMNQETVRGDLGQRALQINLRLNKIDIFHTRDTPPNIFLVLLLKARYIYGTNHMKMIAIN